VTLTWTAMPGAVYRVQSKANLAGAGWDDAEGNVIANESTASKTVPVAGDARFYRVEAVLP
jgi:hypothetical protein